MALVTFPGGDSTAKGQIFPNGLDTTCSVACHSPLGAQSPPVSWNHGPLACTDCHSNVAIATTDIRSSHFAGASPSSGCQSCHDQSQHMGGQVRIINGDGTSTGGTCIGCHSGQGLTLGGQTPPLLVGWTDTVNGDFHGARLGTCQIDRYWYSVGTTKYYQTKYYQPCGSAGPNDINVIPTGFGGTLKSPYARNQDALPCATCHDGHSSTNAFLIAATVNATPIPAGTIDRAGVGAQALCNACHEGDRHEYCKSCHKAYWVTDPVEGYSYFDGPPVDPVPDGSPCFFCHGHEGLQNMKVAAPAWPSNHTYSNHSGGDCSHCHGGWFKSLEYAAPVIQQARWSYVPPSTSYYQTNYPQQPNPAVFLTLGGTVFNVTETSASIYWETNETSTSYVEYGVGTAGYVAGYSVFWSGSFDPANPAGWNTVHRVDLTGLAPNTTYVWRIRTSDAFRNLTETPIQSFRTINPAAPPAPILVPEPMQYNSGGSGNDPWVYWTGQPLQWQAVIGPSGDAVQYRLQLTTDGTFNANEVDTIVAGTSYPLSLSGPLASYVQWYWRVMAIDTVTSLESIWSSVDGFGVGVGDPYNDY